MTAHPTSATAHQQPLKKKTSAMWIFALFAISFVDSYALRRGYLKLSAVELGVVGAFLLVTAVPMVIWLKGSRRNELPALETTLIYYHCAFGVAPLIATRSIIDVGEGMMDMRMMWLLTASLAVMLLAFWLGRSVVRRLPVAAFHPPELPDKSLRFIFLVSVIYVAIGIGLRLFSGELRVGVFVHVFSCIGNFALAYMLAWISGASPGVNVFGRIAMAIAIVPVEIVVRVQTGLIATVMTFFLLGAMVVSRSSGFKMAIFSATAFGALWFFEPVKTGFRDETWTGIGGNASMLERGWSFTQRAFLYRIDGGPAIAIDEGEGFFARFAYPYSALKLVGEETPTSVPYWRGHTLVPLLTSFIPRAIWPDKPSDDTGQEFGHRYGLLNFADFNTSMNMPVACELYANWGALGMLVGYSIVGCIYAFMTSITMDTSKRMSAYIFSVVVFLPMLTHESSCQLTFGGLILSVLLLHIFYRGIRIVCSSVLI